MRKSLLISAAALIAGSGFALAQGMQGGMQGKDNAPGAPQSAPSAQQSAPADRIAPPATTGQGAASTNSNLTGEQHSKISAAIKQQNAQPVRNVNFTISIGTAIPHDVRRAPLPAAVVDVYPVWRGYEYILVEDEILVIDPATLRIVAIVEA